MQYRISHAQNFEDVMLWRALSGVRNGRYIDIGAQSPDIDSVSRMFHEAGWTGVHVDANADYAAQLREARPGDRVVHAAIAAQPGTMRFHEIPDTGLSTASDEIAAHHAESGFAVRHVDVDAMTLDQLFAQVGEGDIHWLKIDIEGGEADALRGWQTSPARPWIVVVESTRPLSQVESHEEWEPMLLAKGYAFAWFDGLNRFYVSDAHRELARAFVLPPNIFDDFALSGQASAPFARHVTAQREQLREELARDRHDLALERAEAAHQREGRQIDRRNAEAAAAAAASAAAAELATARSEAEAMQAAAMERERALSGQLHDTQSQLHDTQAQLRDSQARTQRTEQELQAARTRVEQGRQEAHRWWLEAEGLRGERDTLLRSHSWRLTAPLRAARRLISDPRTASRDYSRRALSFTMRRIVNSPLRGVAQSLLARMPGTRDRLRAFAVARHVIPGVAPLVLSHAVASTHPGLSAEARRVHARLRDAMRGQR